MFWLACEELKREAEPAAVEEKARFIYEDYISILSPKEVSACCELKCASCHPELTSARLPQVSLDSRVREVVNRNMVEPTPHTFDEAQLQIYTLMHRDSYPRFFEEAHEGILSIKDGSAEASEEPFGRSRRRSVEPLTHVPKAAQPGRTSFLHHGDS
ncbi:Uncharacterized protein OBRU01_02008 [Operophtera brumata]|uniref:RGS domain-containing protein n=1 Tax=Operophtera brumata TaxID=104452 RepID=A0A0L7LTY3_OPEBR|nr:Uncharacterized protein OBRU01_02008 [Operophtera brumata]